MNAKYFFAIGLLVSLVTTMGLSSASSRPWKPTPVAIARDYVRILDTRPDGNLVALMWFAPQTIRADEPGAATLTAALQKYVVMLVVHAHVDKISGSVSFEDVPTLEAKNQVGKLLNVVSKNDLPQTLISMLARLEGTFRASAGALGKGVKMFVFDAGDISSCKNGQLSVPLAGETYTWDTPIPGCT